MAITGRPFGTVARISRPSPGIGILIPGLSQWICGQRERGMVLLGMFAAAMSVGLFAWGSRLGAAMLAFAFVAHVVATADVIRQGSFPGFGRWVPTVSATFGLGIGCYLPLVLVASALAWPDLRSGGNREAYLVNRWAYRQVEPSCGEWVWFRTSHGGFGLGQLVAGPGKEVQAEENRLRVDGQRLSWNPLSGSKVNMDMTFRVPDDQYLIAPVAGTPGTVTFAGLLLVSRDDMVGRPWAKLYPVRERHLLF